MLLSKLSHPRLMMAIFFDNICDLSGLQFFRSVISTCQHESFCVEKDYHLFWIYCSSSNWGVCPHCHFCLQMHLSPSSLPTLCNQFRLEHWNVPKLSSYQLHHGPVVYINYKTAPVPSLDEGRGFCGGLATTQVKTWQRNKNNTAENMTIRYKCY